MRNFEIGGWLYEPHFDDYVEPQMHVLKSWHDYEDAPIQCSNDIGLTYWIHNVEEKIEEKQLFYIKPTADYDEFTKQIMLANLKYESKNN
jgi:hypothetical protein